MLLFTVILRKHYPREYESIISEVILFDNFVRTNFIPRIFILAFSVFLKVFLSCEYVFFRIFALRKCVRRQFRNNCIERNLTTFCQNTPVLTIP